MKKQNQLTALAEANRETRYYELAATTAGGLTVDYETFGEICHLHRQAIRDAGSSVAKAHEWIRYADFLLEYRSETAAENRMLRRRAALALDEAAQCYRNAGKCFIPSAQACRQRAAELLG